MDELNYSLNAFSTISYKGGFRDELNGDGVE